MNCVVPVAASRMTESVLPPSMFAMLDPKHIVPMVTYLAHQDTDVTGACYEVGGGWFSKVSTACISESAVKKVIGLTLSCLRCDSSDPQVVSSGTPPHPPPPSRSRRTSLPLGTFPAPATQPRWRMRLEI